ncbi:23S rRNA (Uracil-5-)-methyltransferase rumA [Roseovarius sp. TM1035]|jgi:23S rRNA (uracil1939-C5)-methyltransferase|uniref:class I SAM-dependent RNA methyltransferase n=1 Tax=Roseovarius sp. TM1035 TaxID=391613 RepID=UPI0001556A57|nr:class I SAM-dependent RNA methyltransferase [Roseovarius sp. TM1035]AWZ19806.1 23S rRNA (Uracil-5-) -methyltransferase RumA [Roseovarius sp. AK1035]EDM30286.1 23S rRNA (Uracil-5-)-methyltransferase rumA [Roseovarius sp. TM1035]
MSEHDIIRLGHQGDGIAEGPVYAPLTLPGERISGTLNGQTLTDVRILLPSSDRVSAPCRHFRSCGGCQVQHASDGFVASWKQEVVRAALAAHGIVAEFQPIHTSPPRSRRRATFAAKRTKKGAMAGFHARGSDVIIEVPDCHLLHPEVMRGLSVACDLAETGTSRKAALAVSVTRSLVGLDVAVTDGKPLDGPLRVALAALAERHDLARLAWEDEVVVTRRAPVQVFGGARVVPPPGAFLQATAEGEAALLAQTETILAGARRIVDLFAGCGTFALPLAQRAQVHAVEGEAEMLAALDAGRRGAAGLYPLSTEARDLFRRPLLADELARYDGAVIDPPRAGAEAQIAEIARARLPRLVYVSCNPLTFARDAKTLIAAGYVMGPVRVVDQFRWSTHVELVAGFTLNKA